MPAFFSQVAALVRSLRSLTWREWQPSFHLYLGGEADAESLERWRPHLAGVELIWSSAERFSSEGIWAQSDDVFRFAPEDAEILLTMDADTLAVRGFENVLDRVAAAGSVAGVIAHVPFRPLPGMTPREGWAQLAEGVLDSPLDFSFSHTLVRPGEEEDRRPAPFYVNFGVVFFARDAWERVAPRYLAVRPGLMDRMANSDFSGQAALTLAIADAGSPTWSLPMRFNFPNDPIALELYPDELKRVSIFHYLRRREFDRQSIFTSAEEYARFLELPLSPVNRAFRDAVQEILGPSFPFG